MKAIWAIGVMTSLLAATAVSAAQWVAQTPGSSAALNRAGSISLGPLDGRLDHVSVDVAGRRLFVAAYDAHALEVVDLATGKRVRTLRLDEPQQSYYVPAVNRLFVASSGDGTVKIFDGGTFRLVRTVRLSSDADNMRYDAVRRHVLVDYGGEKYLFGKAVARSGEKDGAVAVLDLNGIIVGHIQVGGHPEALQLEQSTGDRVFINDPEHREIVVASLSSNRVLAHWRAGCDNYPMALDEAHGRLFVFCRDGGDVVVFDTRNGSRVASLPATPGGTSDDMFYDAERRRLYILARMVQNPKNPRGESGPGIVAVIQEEDPDHYRLLATYASGPGAQTGIWVPEWGKLFVAARHRKSRSAEILEYDTRPKSPSPHADHR